jgi:hypothetical protein
MFKLYRTLVVSLAMSWVSHAHAELLDGAFIQLTDVNRSWTEAQWRVPLDRMCAANCNIVIVQYVEQFDSMAKVPYDSFLPVNLGDPDPVGIILDYADANPGMTVFVGLRRDKDLEGSKLLNEPENLQNELANELPLNTTLAAKLASCYSLRYRSCFAGWYLPTEVANYKEKWDPNGPEGWVSQLNKFTTSLVQVCKKLADCPVAVSPFFNGTRPIPDYLVSAAEMGDEYTRFLTGTGISIVMLQDSVGARNVPFANMRSYVDRFMFPIMAACRNASPKQPIEFWLNIECFRALPNQTMVPDDIKRLRKQMAIGSGAAKKLVTFEFLQYLNEPPLYGDYVNLIQVSPGAK